MALIKTLTRRLIMILECVSFANDVHKGAVRNNVPKVILLIISIACLSLTRTTLGYAYVPPGLDRWSVETIDDTAFWYNNQYISAVKDSAGNPHVCYGNKYAVFNGGQWTSQTLTSSLYVYYFMHNSIALNSSQLPGMSFVGTRGGGGYGTVLVYMQYDGNQWTHDYVHRENSIYNLRSSSLSIDAADRPHISFDVFDSSVGSSVLKYASYDGAQWNVEIVDSSSSVGINSSLAIDSYGRPHIAYYDVTHDSLKYAYHDGSNWIISTIDSGPNYTSSSPGAVMLKLDSLNRPHIVYSMCKYAYFTGSEWHTGGVESLLRQGELGTNASLALDSSDNPHIACYGIGNNYLYYLPYMANQWAVQGIVSLGSGVRNFMLYDSESRNPQIFFNDGTWRRAQYKTNMQLQYPNGGESLLKGQSYAISWNRYNITGTVQIDIYKGSANVLQLAASAPNTGSFTFTIPNTLSDGNDYRIGISALNGSVSDFSDSNFSIVTPTLTVTYPNGGQNLQKDLNYFNKQYTIAWNSSYINGNVQIDLYKGDVNVLQIAASAPNTGSYTFNLPNNLSDGNDYRIAISALNGSVWDFSDAFFTISTPVFDINRFSKLGANGELLAIETVWENGLRFVRDDTNHFIWEVKSRNISDANYINNFYTSCNVSSYIQQLNELNYGGRSSWALPNESVLLSSWKAYIGETCDLYNLWETTDGTYSSFTNGLTNSSSANCPLSADENTKDHDLRRALMMQILCSLNSPPIQCGSVDYCTVSSPVRAFSYNGPGPSLVSPINNANLPPNSDLLLMWIAIPNAVSYEIMIDNNSGFGSPEIKYETGGTSYTMTSFLPDNVYSWKIRAKLSFGIFTPWSDPWQFTYSLPVSDAPVWVPLYRMYNNTNKDHFYTTSTTERTDAVANKGYKFEKSEGFVSSLKFNDPNCGYLFRLYNPSTDVHRFTSSESEKDSLIVSGYAYEGITGFIYTKQTEYTSPLFYAEHADNTDHFYTISKFELQNALALWSFTNRGVIGYIGNTIANNRPQGQYSGVDLKTGNLSLPAFTDLSLAGAGPQLNFTRYYNSYDDSTSALGRGWSYSYDSYVLEDTASGNVRVILGNGGDSSFYEDVGGNLVPVPGNFDTITKINDGINYGYDLLRKDQSLYKFRRYSLNTPGPDILLITFADKHGNTVTLDREASYGLVMSATDASSRTFNFEYTPVTLTTGQIVQRLTKVTDTSLSPNRTVSFSYNADGYLTSVSDARGNSTSYTYNSDGLLSGITFPEGNSVTVVYDALQRVVGNTNGTITLSFDYTSGTKVSNAQGLLAQYTHDSTYRATEMLFPDNTKIVPIYNSDNLLNLPQTVTDRNTNATSFTYDARGNVLTSKNALNQTTTFTYDDKNNILTATDPLGYTTTYTYDTNKINLTSVKLPMTGTTTYTYLSSGLVSTITDPDPNNHSVAYTYDANGNPTRINDNSLGTHLDFTYDNAGRLLSKTDQLGRTTTYTYDADNNLTQVKDSTNLSATYAYDRNNRLTSITDFRGKATSYTYNSMNVLATETDPARKVYQYSYDNAGRLSTITAPDGHILSYTYDANNRMTAIKYDGVAKVSFTLYDSNGNLKTMTDGNGTTSFTYDALNRMASYSNSYVGSSVSYGYDASGNRTGITYPGSKTVSYTYDGDNRLTTVFDWLSGTTTYTYDSAGILKSVTNPNGTTTAYSYDAANRLISLANKYSNAAVIADYSFKLNSVGIPTQITKNEPLTPTLPASDISYVYDNANKITTAGGLSHTFDDKGNLSTAGGNSFTFDFANRMTQSIIDSVTTQYLYDGFGNRISRTKGGVQTKYLLDLNGDMSQVLAEINSSGNITNYYVYGNGLISKITAAGDRYVYHYDNIGNTIAITDSSGNITEKYAYDEFGKALSVDETNPNMFRYVGKYGVMDEGNGLLFMRARYYDVENGRFISKDPLGFEGGDLNLYAYVGGNPVVGIDPEGTLTQAICASATIISRLKNAAMTDIKIKKYIAHQEKVLWYANAKHKLELNKKQNTNAYKMINENIKYEWEQMGKIGVEFLKDAAEDVVTSKLTCGLGIIYDVLKQSRESTTVDLSFKDIFLPKPAQ